MSRKQLALTWSWAFVALQAAMLAKYFLAGTLSAAIFGLLGTWGLITTGYSLLKGKLDTSPWGLAVPVLFLSPLLFIPTQPETSFNILFATLVTAQLAMRLYMGWKCSMAVPTYLGLLSSGPYSVVRHPLAAVEASVKIAALLTWPSIHNLAACIASIIAGALIVLIEEDFLRRQPEYQEYCSRVRWRWMPGIW